MPAALLLSYSPVKARSVPAWRKIWYFSGPSFSSHSASLSCIFSVMGGFLEGQSWQRDMGSVQVLDNQHRAIMARHAHPRSGCGIGALGQPFAVAQLDPAGAAVNRVGDLHG